MSNENWPFDESKNTTAFTTTKVVHEKLPVLLVSHDIKSDWQFLCGTTTEAQDRVTTSLGSAVAQDPTLLELWDLPPGWEARRDSSTSPWQREEKEVGYNADAEQIYLFERLGLCRELAKVLCTTLKNNELSQYVSDTNIDGVSKVREIQYLLIVLAEMISAAMEHTKTPSNEALVAALEWCKEESTVKH